MAKYYGSSPSDAARSEERMLDRALNLGLSNRDFLASQRARDNALAQSEYQLSRDNYFKQAELDDSYNKAAETRDYQNRLLDLDKYKTDTGYDINQDRIDSSNEIARLRQEAALGLNVKKGYASGLNAALSGIHSGSIKEIPDLLQWKDKISTDDWEGVLDVLKNAQAKSLAPYESLAAMAKDANDLLFSNPDYHAAAVSGNEGAKRMAMLEFYKTMPKQFENVVPSQDKAIFVPNVPAPATDAIDWFQPASRPKVGMGDLRVSEDNEYNRTHINGRPIDPSTGLFSDYTEPDPPTNPDQPNAESNNLKIKQFLDNTMSNAGQSTETDPELVRAKAAITSGKDPRAVRARYKENTGKEMPL